MHDHQRARCSKLLAELAALCDAHGFTWHAEHARKTAAAFEASDEAGWDHLASIQFWGGPGSIADTSFSPDDVEWHRANGRPVPAALPGLWPEDYRRDNQRHMAILMILAEEMKGCPVTELRRPWLERSKGWSDAFQSWLCGARGA